MLIFGLALLVGGLVYGLVRASATKGATNNSDEISETVDSCIADATAWIESSSPGDSRSIEARLTAIIANTESPKRDTAQNLLDRIRNRNESIAAALPIWHFPDSSSDCLEYAQDRLENDQADLAIAALTQLVLNGSGPESIIARNLLEQLNIATSEQRTIELLVRMSNGEFRRALESGVIQNDIVTDPRIVRIRARTIASVSSAAVERRAIAATEAEERRKRVQNELLKRSEAEERSRQERHDAQERERRRKLLIDAEIEDVINYPSKYLYSTVCFQGVKVHGDIERSIFAGNIFVVCLSSRREKYFVGANMSYVFSLSDTLANALISDVKANEILFNCHVYGVVGQVDIGFGATTHVRVVRVDAHNSEGKMTKSYTE